MSKWSQARTRRWKYRNGIADGEGLVVVDFLTLLRMDRSRGENEASMVKNNAFALARMSKDLGVACLVVMQFQQHVLAGRQ